MSDPPETWRRGEFVIRTDHESVDLDTAHRFLSQSYWGQDRPRELLMRAIANSLPFSLLDGQGQMIGFARVVTDFATVGYVADVFVLDRSRGQGLGQWLVETIVAHPRLAGVTLRLRTLDAHALYARFGFVQLADTTRWMERVVALNSGRGGSS